MSPRPRVGLRTDSRQAGEEGVSVNLQVEATLVASDGALVTDLDALCLALASSGGAAH